LRDVWKWADGQTPLPSDATPEGDGTTWQDIADFYTHARPALDDIDTKVLEAAIGAAERQAARGIERDALRKRVDELERRLRELNPQGRRRRGAVSNEGDAEKEPMQPVFAAIVTSGRGVLVGRRQDGTPPWTFIAGWSNPGESPGDTIIREVKEEACLVVEAGRKLGERVHPGTGRLMVYYAARPTHGTEIHVGDEAELAEVRWIGLAEADELLPGMFEPVREYLSRELGRGAE